MQLIEADEEENLPLGQAMQKGMAGGSARPRLRPEEGHAMIERAPEKSAATPTLRPTGRQSLAGRANVTGDLIAAAKKLLGKLRFWAMPAASMMPQPEMFWNR